MRLSKYVSVGFFILFVGVEFEGDQGRVGGLRSSVHEMSQELDRRTGL